MTVDAVAGEFLGGRGIAVPIRDVESELTRLWGPAAEREGGPTPEFPTVTRVALANLVLGALDDAGDCLLARLQQVLARYPARAIVARGDGSDGSTIVAEVSARCHLPTPGRPQVCCEQITLRAAATNLALLPGAARTLLEAGMPTVLWWAGDPSGHRDIFADFAADATRTLLDLPDPGPLPRLDIPATDLAWYGITGWRERIAELFDPADARPGLGRLCRARVIAATPESGPPPRVALWLVAWLGGQLGWGAGELSREDGEIRARYRSGGRAIDVSIATTVDASTAVPQVVAVELDTDDSGTFRLFRPADRPEEVRVEVCAAHYCDLPRIARTPVAGPAERVSLALEASPVDRTYARALGEMTRLNAVGS